MFTQTKTSYTLAFSGDLDSFLSGGVAASSGPVAAIAQPATIWGGNALAVFNF